VSRSATFAEACRRLGIDPDAIARAPQITPQLRLIEETMRRAGQPKVTTRERTIGHGQSAVTLTEDTTHATPYGPGARVSSAWPQYLHASDSADAALVLSAYYSIPKTFARALPVEAFCVAASISPLRILELVTATIVRQGAQASAIIAAVNHPRVVEKTVEMALTDDGESDRRALDRATGFLPTAKGTQISIAANASASATAQAAAVAAPPPEQTIRRLSDRLNAARGLPVSGQESPALPAANVIPIPADANPREPMTIDLPLDADDDVDEEMS